MTIGQSGDDLGTPLVVPGERRLRSVDDETEVVDDPDAELFAGVDRNSTPESLQHVAEPRALDASLIREAGAAMLRSGHEPPLYLGPATSADLLELDAVPNPVDSDAPVTTFGAQRWRAARDR